MVLQQMIQNMMNLGFFQFLFPFLLALAIVYGLLSWALKEQFPPSARGLISLIIAFFVMLFSSWNYYVINFFATISGEFLVVAVGFILIVMLLAITGTKPQDLMKNEKAKWILILLVVFIGIVIFFGAGAAWLIPIPTGMMTSQFWTVLFFIVILALVFWFMGKEEGGGSGGSGGEQKEGK